MKLPLRLLFTLAALLFGHSALAEEVVVGEAAVGFDNSDAGGMSASVYVGMPVT